MRLLDTNILVYALNKSAGEKREVAKSLVADSFRGEPTALSVQNLNEFFHVATTHLEHPLDPQTAHRFIDDIHKAGTFTILPITEDICLSAMEMDGPHWDALIAAAMQANDIQTIYTENEQDFNDFERIDAVNPFSD